MSLRLTSALTACLVLGSTSHAAELDYGLRIGAIHTDNARRLPENEETDTIALVGLDIDWSGDEASRFVWSLVGNLDYQHYTDDTFDDEVLGAVNFDADAALIRDTVHWVFTHRFGQLVSDPFLASTVDNRGNVNNSSTGPDLTLRMGPRSRAVLSGRYQANRFEERDADNDVVSGNLSLERDVRQNRRVSLTGTFEDVDFDNELNTDYERLAATLGFNSQVSRGSVAVSVGWNEVRIADNELDGLLADISVSRELSARTTLTLGYNQRYSNAGDLFNQFQNPGLNFGEPQEIAGDAAPFESRGFNAGLVSNNGGNSWSVRLLSLDESFESDNPLDRQRHEIQARVSREVARGWRIALDGRFVRFDFRNADREDDDASGGLEISRQLTRQFDLVVGYLHVDRSSSDPLADFTENRFTLTIRFAPD